MVEGMKSYSSQMGGEAGPGPALQSWRLREEKLAELEVARARGTATSTNVAEVPLLSIKESLLAAQVT